MITTTIMITLTGNGLHIEQMSLRACWYVNYYLSLLPLERKRAVLGNLRIDLYMDSGPVPIERVREMRGWLHGQRDLSAPGKWNILVNCDRLARLDLSDKHWVDAGNL
ncbi:hypothetical protein KSB_78350 [Ktedonobacter robiniae]|uniref:STAS domain-containing protein n=1 Tax=Ktedonobacter robiniae TaxID=2778365 RepID=A0ABQ3V3Z2_9CHLR|nr:hypothetical protein KSB_78350 [Ktedonobacter robiniae]